MSEPLFDFRDPLGKVPELWWRAPIGLVGDPLSREQWALLWADGSYYLPEVGPCADGGLEDRGLVLGRNGYERVDYPNPFVVKFQRCAVRGDLPVPEGLL